MTKRSSGYSVRYRSAETGRYVSKKYAEKHPRTTVRETDKK
ncbi:MAG: multidrug transporter [Candidatus Paceibacterota bacterium]